MSAFISILTGLVMGLALTPPVCADSVAEFYKGKTITMIILAAPGGINDITGRLVVRHLVQYLPGHPAHVSKNQLGAQGMSGANLLYNAAPRDGTTLAIVQRSAALTRPFGDAIARYDPERFTWLGSTSSFADDAYGFMVMADRPFKTWEDLKKPEHKAVFGAMRAGSTNLTFALFARDVLKLNIDVIRGYGSAAQSFLAMQRGELDGQAIGLAAVQVRAADMWNDKKLRVLIQFARETRHPDLPDVPTGRELVTNAEDLNLLKYMEAPFKMALPFLAPPDVPEDRTKALRDAFMKAHGDKEFLAEARKRKLDVSPIDGEELAKLVAEINQAPQSVVNRFREIAGIR